MGLLKDIFTKRRTRTTGYTEEEVESAKKDEPEDYITICQRFFFSKIGGRPVAFSNRDTDMSDLDRMIMPNIIAGAITGIAGSGVNCDESCPGYTPLPVEPFRMPGADIVRCQRYIPTYMLDKGWGALREKAVEFHKEHGGSYE